MRATAQSVKSVSERVTSLAAALASKNYLCSTSSTRNPKNVSRGRTNRWTVTVLSVGRCFLSRGQKDRMHGCVELQLKSVIDTISADQWVGSEFTKSFCKVIYWYCVTLKHTEKTQCAAFGCSCFSLNSLCLCDDECDSEHQGNISKEENPAHVELRLCKLIERNISALFFFWLRFGDLIWSNCLYHICKTGWEEAV